MTTLSRLLENEGEKITDWHTGGGIKEYEYEAIYKIGSNYYLYQDAGIDSEIAGQRIVKIKKNNSQSEIERVKNKNIVY